MHPQSSDYKSEALLLSHLTKLCSGWELNPLTFSGFHRTAVPACSTLHCSYWYGFRSCTDLLLSAYIGTAWQSQPRLARRFVMNELSSYSDLSTVCDRRAVNGVVQSMPPRSALSSTFYIISKIHSANQCKKVQKSAKFLSALPCTYFVLRSE